jgi:hypothetical protein
MENFSCRFKPRWAVRHENMAIRVRTVYLRGGWKRRDGAMQLVDLILMACALANPSACRERHLLFQTAGSLRGCTMQAQPYLAQWAGEHPGFRIASWRCAWPDQEEEKG